jgi:hypothetical protein
MKNLVKIVFVIVLPCLLLASTGASADPVLDIVVGGQTRQFGRDELLRRQMWPTSQLRTMSPTARP